MHLRAPTPIKNSGSTAVIVERLQQVPIFEGNEISSAIRDGDIEYLKKLTAPFKDGGVGWSLDVTDNLDYGPELQAANAGQFQMLAALLKPVSEGGFGRSLPSDQLQIYPYHADNVSRVMTIQHSRLAPAKCETLTLLDVAAATTESYKLGQILGSGAYGSVYSFHCGDKKIAVKIPQDMWTEYSLGDTEFEWDQASDEFKFLCQAYPHEGPYALQSLRKYEDGKQLYSWRLMMPFVPGEPISTALSKVTDPLLAAKIVLRTAKELHKLHTKRNMCHGDIRPGNILVNVTDKKIDVHLIDFAFAYDMSGLATYMGRDKYSIVPPERQDELPSRAHPAQDIWSLAKTLEWSMPAALKITMQLFPSVNKFISDAAEVDPDKRPTLPDFIDTLRAEIQSYEESRKYVRNNRFFREDRIMKNFHQDLQRMRANHLMRKL